MVSYPMFHLFVTAGRRLNSTMSRLGAQLVEDGLGVDLVEVQRHVILGWVDVHEHGPLLLVEPPERVKGARHVAYRRELDLDDLGAQCSEERGACRPEEQMCRLRAPADPLRGAGFEYFFFT